VCTAFRPEALTWFFLLTWPSWLPDMKRENLRAAAAQYFGVVQHLMVISCVQLVTQCGPPKLLVVIFERIISAVVSKSHSLSCWFINNWSSFFSLVCVCLCQCVFGESRRNSYRMAHWVNNLWTTISSFQFSGKNRFLIFSIGSRVYLIIVREKLSPSW
jgi:hypothetical protein